MTLLTSKNLRLSNSASRAKLKTTSEILERCYSASNVDKNLLVEFSKNDVSLVTPSSGAAKMNH